MFKRVFSGSFVLLLLIVSFVGLHPEVSVTELKGLDEVLTDDYKHLSPVQGCLAWKTRYIENIYRSAIKSGPQELINYMFHLQHDGVTFGPTISPTSLATYLDEEITGEIMGVIQKHRSQKEQSKDELSKTLIKVFADRSESLEKIISEKLSEQTKKLQGYINEYEQLHRIKEKEKQLNVIEKKLLKIQETKKKLEEGKLGTGKKKGPSPEQLKNAMKKLESNKAELVVTIKKQKENIKNYEQQEGKYDELKKRKSGFLKAIKTFKDMSLKSMAQEFAQKMTDVFFLPKEDKKLFDEHILERILLAHLWRKSDTRLINKTEKKASRYFWNYFNGIAKQIDEKKFLQSANILDQESDAYKTFITKKAYSFDDYKNCVKNVDEWVSDESSLKDHFSDIVFRYFGYFLYEYPYPPHVRGANVTYKGITFPDCGSTSARNFWNCLLFNKEKSKFDLELLEKIVPKTIGTDSRRGVYNFYSDHTGFDDIETQDTYDDWASVCSGIPGVNYINEGIAEINAGLINMSKVLAYQIGFDRSKIDDKNLPKKVFDEFASRLEKHKVNLGHEIPDEVTTEKNLDVTYNFKLEKEDGRLEWTWYFGASHFQVNFKTKETSQMMTGDVYEKLCEYKHPSLVAPLLQVFYIDKKSENFLSFFKQNKEFISYFLYADDDYLKVLLVKEFKDNKNYLADLNGRVLPGIKSLDLRKKTVGKLIKENEINFIEGITITLKQSPDDFKAQYLVQIISEEKKDFYVVIDDILPGIAHEESRSKVLSSLIENNFAKEYEEEIGQALNNFKEAKRRELLSSLIENNLAEKYEEEIGQALNDFNQFKRVPLLSSLIANNLAEKYKKEIGQALNEFRSPSKVELINSLIKNGLTEKFEKEIAKVLETLEKFNKSTIMQSLKQAGELDRFKDAF